MAILRFEPITERHLPAILDIENATHGLPWSERAFRNEIDSKHGVFLTVLLDHELVGYGSVWVAIDEAHITTIAVKESHRREGIGRKLMNRLLTDARERGATCSTLEVRAGNTAAISLYEKLGYRRVSVRKGYYPDNREDAVVMWLYELETWVPTP